MDKWKVFQVDNDLSVYDTKVGIEVFWEQVFELHASNSDYRYKVLPVVVKSGLVLVQTNAESECSLLVNARIRKDPHFEKTILGLNVVKEAVQFFDPVSN